MVVAESIAAAKDAAERVAVDYDALQPVTVTAAAAQPQAPRLYDHTGNVCIDADVGDVEATEAAFARATHVAKLDTWVHRVTGVPLDARAAVGVYDPATNKYTLHAGSGGVVRQKAELADDPRRRSRRSCASNAATSAAISAPATPSSRSSRWWSGRRSASAAR